MRKTPLPYPLLSDSKHEVTEKFTYTDYKRKAPLPSLFVTDRFGELYYQQMAHEADELPNGDEVLDWVLFIQVQCPECSHL